ncbi:MAG: hypothetical protein KDA58_03765 [Planctomycetaceae bacterium]|nr:hypothetical protein [Planctomycetaceae bacterium]
MQFVNDASEKTLRIYKCLGANSNIRFPTWKQQVHVVDAIEIHLPSLAVRDGWHAQKRSEWAWPGVLDAIISELGAMSKPAAAWVGTNGSG